MRVVVIGAGIVGVHVAVELARRGADVTLVDGGEPGSGTTAGSFAWIDASHPGVAPYLELRLLGLEAWRRQADELGGPSWISLGGTLTWTAAAHTRDQLEAHVRLLEERGHGPARLSASEAHRREPALVLPADADPIYHFAGAGWVLPRPAIGALLARGRAAGLRVRVNAEARELILGGSGGVTAVLLGSCEELRSDVVVSCVGRWTESLLRLADVRIPMLTPDPPGPRVAGLVVLTTRARRRLGCVISADGLVIRPERDGRLLLHSDAHDEGIPGQTVPELAAEELVALLRTRIRGTQETGVEQARICVRALPADRLPVVGRALDGLYVVATHSGVTLAPAFGELVAGELLDDRDNAALAAFRPARFQPAAA
jgi:glycine/D-amino acid oxidase-like deaminating enzyme